MKAKSFHACWLGLGRLHRPDALGHRLELATVPRFSGGRMGALILGIGSFSGVRGVSVRLSSFGAQLGLVF